uniref:Transmembrane protein n=2 Tax=Chrysotila carterae TaxID=13221 RepID=A0A7S4B5X8_CHRCT
MSLLEALNLLASVYGTYHNHATHKQTLSHDQELHVRALAASTEQHYQQLIAELLAAAKEADRDVWEQRNGQFNNLMLSAILMFGVAMSAIIEGNFDKHENYVLSMAFAACEALSLSLLFLCLVCCLLVSRRMSIYMIQRAAKYVDRLGEIISSADDLVYGAAEVQPLPKERATGSFTKQRLSKQQQPETAEACGRCEAPGSAATRLEQMHSGRTEFQKQLMRALETTAGGAAARMAQKRRSLSHANTPPRLSATPSMRPEGDDDQDDSPLLAETVLPSDVCETPQPTPHVPASPTPRSSDWTHAGSRGHMHATSSSLRGGCSIQGKTSVGGRSLLNRASSESSDARDAVRVAAFLNLHASEIERAETFNEFWLRSCALMSRVAFNSFYFGTGCVWGSVIIFFIASYDEVDLSIVILFIGICGAGLLTSLVFFWEIISSQLHHLSDGFPSSALPRGSSAHPPCPCPLRTKWWAPSSRARAQGYPSKYPANHPANCPRSHAGSYPSWHSGRNGFALSRQQPPAWELRMRQRILGTPRRGVSTRTGSSVLLNTQPVSC